MMKSEWVLILAELQGPVTNCSTIRTLDILRTLEMQHGQSTFLLQSGMFVQIHTCIHTHTHKSNKYKARL